MKEEVPQRIEEITEKERAKFHTFEEKTDNMEMNMQSPILVQETEYPNNKNKKVIK